MKSNVKKLINNLLPNTNEKKITKKQISKVKTLIEEVQIADIDTEYSNTELVPFEFTNYMYKTKEFLKA